MKLSFFTFTYPKDTQYGLTRQDHQKKPTKKKSQQKKNRKDQETEASSAKVIHILSSDEESDVTDFPDAVVEGNQTIDREGIEVPSDAVIIKSSDEDSTTDHDDKGTVSESKQLYYYKENSRIPIFRSGKCSLSFSDFFDILVDRPDFNIVATELPSLVESNLSFAISVDPSDVPLSDINCDGHSVWLSDGVRRFTYSKQSEQYRMESVKKQTADVMKINNFLLVKKYFHHILYFVREIKQFPEPFVVLGTDQQLFDLERFCSDDAVTLCSDDAACW